MPVTLKSPGVYIEEDASVALSVSNSPTAVPVFIGKFTLNTVKPIPVKSTPVKLILSCIRINNWLEFTSAFSLAPRTEVLIKSSPPKNEGKISTSAEGHIFSQDEDKPKWTHDIQSITLSPTITALQLYFQNGGGACYICPLNDANDESVLATIPELIEQQGDITLLVCPEDDADYKKSVYTAVTPLLSGNKVGYFLITDSPNGDQLDSVGNTSKAATYYPNLKTDLKFLLPDDEGIIINGYQNGTDGNPPKNLKELKGIDNEFAQRIVSQLKEKEQNTIVPPSAVIAGIYCQTDSQRGVWKAPANVAITGIKGLTDIVDDARQGDMNDKGVNVIRSFTGRGFMVWGARTCTEVNDTNWRYIPVRRLFNSVERDIRQALRAVLFETNNQPIWMRVKAAVDHYLYAIWQKNALMGNTPEEAYFVQIGQGITMSDTDIKQGKMIMKVGLAAVRPAEFIVLQFTQDVMQ
ncbi:phage tail sheath protein [Xenorhabdus stockiae]|uniref:Phage tail sheath protein n=1 Tax=Xenorhabdus stockiae TaxID=351614 RepID=A0A2D0KTY3_9GAMM|nr:phage tail sheath subtilisin-like domain-containing protein [Xenorhabdus stockiae]PHM66677.1 phage tail sheath protein [Xenorhabdus stockiae]